MPEYRYLTGQARGQSSSSPAEITIARREPFLENTRGWRVCAERWMLHGVFLPVFDATARDVVVGIYRKSDGQVFNETVVFTDTYSRVAGGSGQYLYDLRDVADGVNTALATASAAAGVPGADVPTFTTDGRLFTLTSTSTFRTDYDIRVNDGFEYYWGTFRFVPVSGVTDFTIQLANDVETQEGSTLEFLSPVCRIAIDSGGLPVDFELIPPPSSTDLTVADTIGSFLVDYRYIPTGNQSRVSLLYTADESRRWHSMREARGLRSFTLSFEWYDYENTPHQISLGQDGFAEVKMLFENPE